MRLLLLFILTLVKADTPCNMLLPGMQMQISGMAITNADIRANPYPVLQPVIDLTCNLGKKVYNPYTNSSYDLPDQFSSVLFTSAAQTTIKTFLVDNTYELEVELNAEQTASVNYIIGSYSASESVGFTLNVFINEFRSAGIAKSTIYATQLFLYDANMLNISIGLKNFIDTQFPNGYTFNEKTVYTYNNMFDEYGTDYNTKGTYGGEMCEWYYCLKSLYSVESSASIQVDASNNLGNIIYKAGGGGSINAVSSSWVSATVVNMEWRGGVPPGPTVDYATWAGSIPLNPTALQIDLQPISNLFYFSPTLQSNTLIARTNYMDYHLLVNEISPSLTMFLQVLNQIRESGVCYVPNSCATYPSYPSCGTQICPQTCPSTSAYCGEQSWSCCTYTDPTSYNNYVNKIYTAVNKLKTDITNLQTEITNVLQSPILNHTVVVDIWNKYILIMQAMDTTIKEFDCWVNYLHTDMPCYQWSTIDKPDNKCSTHQTSSKATSCPYDTTQTKYASIWYPSGIMKYNGTTMEEPLIIDESKMCTPFEILINGNRTDIELIYDD
jgi:hypothetical protein